MLKDCNYDKTRLLYELSRLLGYLKRHAKEDAEKEGHKKCISMYEEMEADLEKHLEKLKMAIAEASKEGKFD